MADVGVTKEGIVVAGQLALTWEEVDAQRDLFRFADKVLIKISFSYSRGDWYDYQIMDKATWENYHAALNGKEGWFHDFAGKHSEACLSFWDDVDLEVITDQTEIAAFHRINGWSDSNLDIISESLDQLWSGGELSRKDGLYYEAGSIEGADEE